MPKKENGIPFEIERTPMKDSSGHSFYYVRPQQGRSVSLEELDYQCTQNMGMPKNMLVNAFNYFLDAATEKLADGVRIETPLGSFYPTLRLKNPVTEPDSIHADDVSLQTVEFRPTKRFISTVRTKNYGFHQTPGTRRDTADFLRNSKQLHAALTAAFADSDTITVHVFREYAHITKYAAMKFLNSLCEGDSPKLVRTLVGRTYIYTCNRQSQ